MIFNMNQGQQLNITLKGVTVEKMDIFIDRIIKEQGYTLHMLGQYIHNTLQARTHPNLVEEEAYKHILRRIAQRHKQQENG